MSFAQSTAISWSIVSHSSSPVLTFTSRSGISFCKTQHTHKTDFPRCAQFQSEFICVLSYSSFGSLFASADLHSYGKQNYTDKVSLCARPSHELHWLDLKIGCKDNYCNYCRQCDFPSFICLLHCLPRLSRLLVSCHVYPVALLCCIHLKIKSTLK